MRESIASVENAIYYLNDIRFFTFSSFRSSYFIRKVSKINIRIIYDYNFIKPQILRQNVQWSFWLVEKLFFQLRLGKRLENH